MKTYTNSIDFGELEAARAGGPDGEQCSRCDKWFPSKDINNDWLCPQCAEEAAEEAKEMKS